jgi:hypothetical protein
MDFSVDAVIGWRLRLLRIEDIEDGRLSPRKADDILLTMPDNTYWPLGESLGRARQIGKELIKK